MAYRTLPHGRESGLPSVPHFVVSAAAAAAATAESLPGNGASRYPERSSRPSTQDGMRQVVALQEEDEEEEEEEEEEGEEEELGGHRAAAQMADLADCDLPHRGLDAQRGLQGHHHLLPPGDGEQQQEGKGGGQDMKSKLSLLNETVNIKLGAPTWLSSSSSTNLRKQQQAAFVDGEQGRKWCGCEAGSQCVQCSFLHLHAYPAAAGPPPASHPSAAPSTQWLSTSMAMASKAPQPGGGGGAAEVLGEDVPSDSIMALSAQQSHGSADINQSSSAQGRGLLEMHSDTANSSDLVEGDAGEQDTRNIWQNAGLKAEILSHPLYEQLLAEHVACLRVATPVDQLPRIDAQLDQSQHVVAKYSVLAGHNHLPGSEEKEELDQFMTHYVLLLCSFKEQLQQHVRVHAMEAVMACWELEQSLLSLTGISPGEGTGATMSDDDDDQEDSDLGLYDTGLDGPDSGGFGPLIPTETERSLMERVRQELKTELKQGYRERIVDVREEILRKRRAGKLPGDTTSVLKSWWQSHCKWPYPTEEEKARLVQETGLQLKQINNWFINQRKRNWHSNPSSSSLKNKRKR